MAVFACSLAGGTARADTPTPSPAATPIRASKIILIGDSTVAVQGGWGSSFCAEHVTSFAACLNLARGGRSSGSYIAEGSWELALNEARAPGYVATWLLIQFGHNDQPGKPGRSTDLATEFPANLRRYVTEARAVGAQPVLITPLTRRIFKDGKLENGLAPWAETIARVANEMKVPLIDLNARSTAAVQAMGSTAANEFASLPPSPAVAAAAATGTTIPATTETNDRSPPPALIDPKLPPLAQPKLSFDYTHLGRKGSDYFAAMVTAELATAVPEMRPLLIL
ncbi:rhamnogalacturonan acetylesterase [Steroidobacter flavus]|uniref:Rhamnogalacturonan acetylesterase n=1 Tax=Steroidobacter flavus TaxID=1842136 RepID=A0ABV8SMS4_9GAMM